jgi:hypothetical protein
LHKKKPYKTIPYNIELLQAAVDFHPLAQPLDSRIADVIGALQHTRHCSRSPSCINPKKNKKKRRPHKNEPP